MRALALLLVVAAAACAASGSPEQPRGTRPPSIEVSGSGVDINIAPDRAVVGTAIQATPEAAWAALPLAWADLGIPVKERSDPDRTLGNSRLVISRRLGEVPLSRYLECGSGLTGAFADRYRIEMLIRSSIVPAAGGARVDTYIEATARNPEGSSNTRVACSSSRYLEQAIAERVRAHVAGA